MIAEVIADCGLCSRITFSTPSPGYTTANIAGMMAKYFGRGGQDVQAGRLHLRGLDLLAQVLRGRPDHQTGDEDRDHRDHQRQFWTGAVGGRPVLTGR
jgi:hypothetical protein